MPRARKSGGGGDEAEGGATRRRSSRLTGKEGPPLPRADENVAEEGGSGTVTPEKSRSTSRGRKGKAESPPPPVDESGDKGLDEEEETAPVAEKPVTSSGGKGKGKGRGGRGGRGRSGAGRGKKEEEAVEGKSEKAEAVEGKSEKAEAVGGKSEKDEVVEDKEEAVDEKSKEKVEEEPRGRGRRSREVKKPVAVPTSPARSSSRRSQRGSKEVVEEKKVSDKEDKEKDVAEKEGDARDDDWVIVEKEDVTDEKGEDKPSEVVEEKEEKVTAVESKDEEEDKVVEEGKVEEKEGEAEEKEGEAEEKEGEVKEKEEEKIESEEPMEVDEDDVKIKEVTEDEEKGEESAEKGGEDEPKQAVDEVTENEQNKLEENVKEDDDSEERGTKRKAEDEETSVKKVRVEDEGKVPDITVTVATPDTSDEKDRSISEVVQPATDTIITPQHETSSTAAESTLHSSSTPPPVSVNATTNIDESHSNLNGEKDNDIDDDVNDDVRRNSDEESILGRSFLRCPLSPASAASEETLSRRRFNIVSYDVMPARVVAPDAALRLIDELKELGADVICLQHVQQDMYTTHLEPALKQMGMMGYYSTKSADTGVLTYFKSSVFTVLEEFTSHFHDIVEKDVQSSELSDDYRIPIREFIKSPSLVQYVKLKSTTVSDNTLTVGNVQTECTEFPNLLALQSATSVCELMRCCDNSQQPHILCGNFNIAPTSPAYQLLRDGYLSNEMIDELQMSSNVHLRQEAQVQKTALVNLLWRSFQHTDQGFKSAYSTVMGCEPVTHIDCIEDCTADGCDERESTMRCHDYVWYNNQSLQLLGVLLAPPTVTINPSHFPSQHLPLKAQLAFIN